MWKKKNNTKLIKRLLGTRWHCPQVSHHLPIDFVSFLSDWGTYWHTFRAKRFELRLSTALRKKCYVLIYHSGWGEDDFLPPPPPTKSIHTVALDSVQTREREKNPLGVSEMYWKNNWMIGFDCRCKKPGSYPQEMTDWYHVVWATHHLSSVSRHDGI